MKAILLLLKILRRIKLEQELDANQQAHYLKALKLEEEAAKALDKVKKSSPKAAELITRANVERQKAGLIKGTLAK